MGKDNFLTPKQIANRIKAKGLQKLRWYCQLCQKQCRDENGFKCHQMSDGHMRQMALFGMNAGGMVAQFSRQFEDEFLDHLRRGHPGSRVAANVVYNEYIQNRHHVHMNSTRWLTLTEFVKYLGREGKCKVEETPKGWFITLIRKDTLEELSKAERLKRERAEMEEEERAALAIKQQVKRARQQAQTDAEQEEEDEAARALQRDENGEPIVLGLAPKLEPAAAAGPAAAKRPPLPPSSKAALFGDEEEEGPGSSRAAAAAPRKLSKVEELMQRDLAAKQQAAAKGGAAAQQQQQQQQRQDSWLHVGIIVKVMAKELKEHGYYKAKGLVEALASRYVAEVCMLDTGDVVRVDQAQLETVIPSPGGRVLVVNGQYRGEKGVLVAIDTGRYQAEVELRGAHGGRRVWLEYEDVCKYQGSGGGKK